MIIRTCSVFSYGNDQRSRLTGGAISSLTPLVQCNGPRFPLPRIAPLPVCATGTRSFRDLGRPRAPRRSPGGGFLIDARPFFEFLFEVTAGHARPLPASLTR